MHKTFSNKVLGEIREILEGHWCIKWITDGLRLVSFPGVFINMLEWLHRRDFYLLIKGPHWCDGEAPGVYLSVGPYTEWINEKHNSRGESGDAFVYIDAPYVIFLWLDFIPLSSIFMFNVTWFAFEIFYKDNSVDTFFSALGLRTALSSTSWDFQI